MVTQDALKLLEDKNSEEILGILPTVLLKLNYEGKREVLATLLCEEWYLITHYEYIKALLDVFADSVK